MITWGVNPTPPAPETSTKKKKSQSVSFKQKNKTQKKNKNKNYQGHQAVSSQTRVAFRGASSPEHRQTPCRQNRRRRRLRRQQRAARHGLERGGGQCYRPASISGAGRASSWRGSRPSSARRSRRMRRRGTAPTREEAGAVAARRRRGIARWRGPAWRRRWRRN